MTKASSEALPACAGGRIIAAEALQDVACFSLSDLGAGGAPTRRLTSRDLSNEAARAAYSLGRRRGFEEGARTGLRQGFSEGSQALEDFESRKAADVAAQMQRLVEVFQREMAALEAQVATDLVSLAIDIAREVLRRELSVGAQALLPAAREALRVLGEGASRLELHVHPADAALLETHLEACQSGQCRVTSEPGAQRGSCRVEADTGVAEAGFEARWQAVMATLGRDEEPLP